jgi:hypothetical protein
MSDAKKIDNEPIDPNTPTEAPAPVVDGISGGETTRIQLPPPPPAQPAENNGQGEEHPPNFDKLCAKVQFVWRGRQITGMTPWDRKDGTGTDFFAHATIQTNAGNVQMMKLIPGATSVEDAYAKFDETVKAGMEEFRLRLVRRNIEQILAHPGGPGVPGGFPHQPSNPFAKNAQRRRR